MLLDTPYGINIFVQRPLNRERVTSYSVALILLTIIFGVLFAGVIWKNTIIPYDGLFYWGFLSAMGLGYAYLISNFIPQLFDQLLVNETILINGRYIWITRSGFLNIRITNEYPYKENDTFQFTILGYDNQILFSRSKQVIKYYESDLRITNAPMMRKICKGISQPEAERIIGMINARYPQYRIQSYMEDRQAESYIDEME